MEFLRIKTDVKSLRLGQMGWTKVTLHAFDKYPSTKRAFPSRIDSSPHTQSSHGRDGRKDISLNRRGQEFFIHLFYKFFGTPPLTYRNQKLVRVPYLTPKISAIRFLLKPSFDNCPVFLTILFRSFSVKCLFMVFNPQPGCQDRAGQEFCPLSVVMPSP